PKSSRAMVIFVTPNLVEQARLTGSAPASDEKGAWRQADELSRTVRAAVLVKGGHAQGSRCIDVLLQPNLPSVRFDAPRWPRGMRGTGCMLSSAVASSLAHGASLEASVSRARQYVFDALARSKDIEPKS
ncbi:MAG: hydroxymethylpyrimidine/phosphomethylpyrimidine kinase, partial [Mesorhizobium sp.]